MKNQVVALFKRTVDHHSDGGDHSSGSSHASHHPVSIRNHEIVTFRPQQADQALNLLGHLLKLPPVVHQSELPQGIPYLDLVALIMRSLFAC